MKHRVSKLQNMTQLICNGVGIQTVNYRILTLKLFLLQQIVSDINALISALLGQLDALVSQNTCRNK